VERAKREMPGGKTIAHGYLTLSLLPRLSHEILHIRKRSRGINYGSNRLGHQRGTRRSFDLDLAVEGHSHATLATWIHW
jgi:hypothetical protein